VSRSRAWSKCKQTGISAARALLLITAARSSLVLWAKAARMVAIITGDLTATAGVEQYFIQKALKNNLINHYFLFVFLQILPDGYPQTPFYQNHFFQ